MVEPPENGQVNPKTNPSLNDETLKWIVLPMAGVGGLVLLGAMILLIMPKRLQVSLIADWLMTVLFLCPTVICLFPLCLLLILAIVGMNRAHQATAPPLARVVILSALVRNRTVQTTEEVNRQALNASARLAFLDRLLAIFDPPVPPPDDLTKEE